MAGCAVCKVFCHGRQPACLPARFEHSRQGGKAAPQHAAASFLVNEQCGWPRDGSSVKLMILRRQAGGWFPASCGLEPKVARSRGYRKRQSRRAFVLLRETDGPKSRFLRHICSRGVPLQRHLIAEFSGATRARLDDLSDAALLELKSRSVLANPGCATGSRRAIACTKTITLCSQRSISLRLTGRELFQSKNPGLFRRFFEGLPTGGNPGHEGWVVERTFSWFGRNRRLAKDFENLTETLATFVTLASIQRALRRLARS
jgi:hypothetical protein